MKWTPAVLALTIALAKDVHGDRLRSLKGKEEVTMGKKKGGKKDSLFRKCNKDGKSDYPYQGMDASQRLLAREGVIPDVPDQLCGHDGGKNVILVIGDGMVSVNC